MSRDGSRGTDEAVRRAAADGDAVALTQVLVSTPSVNPLLEDGGSGEAAVAELCAGWLRRWGFEVEVTEIAAGRPNVVARHGHGSGRSLLLNGHMDTVGMGGMSVPPFEGLLREGRILGRGSCDMKGGVASLLAAARALAAEGHGGTLLVALTCDEEHASIGMAGLVESGVRAEAAVVCEPTELAVMPAHKGFVWIDADFRGRAAHGSRPDVGVDAIRHAARYLESLSVVDAALEAGPSHPLLGRGSWHAGTVAGGSAASVYPGRCRLTLERRTLPGEDPATVVEAFGRALEELRRGDPAVDADLTQGLTRPGTEVPEDHPLVRGLVRACRDHGLPGRVEGMTAWVDAAFLNEAGVPAVCFGPGSIGQAHSADEWIAADQIPVCAAVLTDFGRAFLNPRSPSAG